MWSFAAVLLIISGVALMKAAPIIGWSLFASALYSGYKADQNREYAFEAILGLLGVIGIVVGILSAIFGW